MALCGCNHRFLTVTEDSTLVVASEKAQEQEVMTVSKPPSIASRDGGLYIDME